MVVWQAMSVTTSMNPLAGPSPWSGRTGAFILHTAMVFVCAIIGFPGLIWRLPSWIQLFVHVPWLEQAWSWYLPHIALVNLALSIAVGYGMGAWFEDSGRRGMDGTHACAWGEDASIRASSCEFSAVSGFASNDAA